METKLIQIPVKVPADGTCHRCEIYFEECPHADYQQSMPGPVCLAARAQPQPTIDRRVEHYRNYEIHVRSYLEGGSEDSGKLRALLEWGAILDDARDFSFYAPTRSQLFDAIDAHLDQRKKAERG